VLAAPRLLCLTDLAEAGKTQASTCSKQGMTTHETRTPAACRPAGPPADVVAWRACRLHEAGFPWALADSVARTHTDLHELLQLVDAGCPPQLAARILAPIDEVSGPW